MFFRIDEHEGPCAKCSIHLCVRGLQFLAYLRTTSHDAMVIAESLCRNSQILEVQSQLGGSTTTGRGFGENRPGLAFVHLRGKLFETAKKLAIVAGLTKF